MAEETKKRRVKRAFTDDFKAGAVRLVLVEGKTVPQVARDLDLTQSSLRGWVDRARADQGKGRPGVLTSAERDELTALRKKVRELSMERGRAAQGGAGAWPLRHRPEPEDGDGPARQGQEGPPHPHRGAGLALGGEVPDRGPAAARDGARQRPPVPHRRGAAARPAAPLAPGDRLRRCRRHRQEGLVPPLPAHHGDPDAEGGADTRFIQQMLGHESLESTQLYTQVSIRKLQDIYLATHPAAKLQARGAASEENTDEVRAELLAQLDVEGEGDD